MAAFKQLYMLVLDVSKCKWTHVFSVVLLLLSVVLSTAWDYLSCLPFKVSAKKKKNTSLKFEISVCYDLRKHSVDNTA